MKRVFKLLCVVSLVFSLVGCAGTKKINLSDYVKTNIEGTINGHATLNLEVDYDTMTKDIGEKKFQQLKKKIESYEYIEMIEGLNAHTIIYVTADKTNDLSNGDIISIYAEDQQEIVSDWNEVTKALGVEFVGFDITVEGLTEPVLIDFLQDKLDSTYIDGCNGKAVIEYNNDPLEDRIIFDDGNIMAVTSGTAHYEIMKDNKALSTIYCSIDKESNISNGDVITYSLAYDSSLIELGYAPKVEKVEVNVTDLPDEITKRDQIVDNLIDRMGPTIDELEYLTANEKWQMDFFSDKHTPTFDPNEYQCDMEVKGIKVAVAKPTYATWEPLVIFLDVHNTVQTHGEVSEYDKTYVLYNCYYDSDGMLKFTSYELHWFMGDYYEEPETIYEK